MRFINRHWYNIGGVVAIGTSTFLVFSWNTLDMLVRLQLLSFIAILVHQFEEYGWPGGGPAIMNRVIRKSDRPDRYPLNQFSAMLGNVLITYTVYLIPVFFPNVIWLGLMPMLFGFGQFPAHAIVGNLKLKSFYNPGLAAVLFLHIPVGIYYIYYVVSNGLASRLDWVIAIVYLLIVLGLFGVLTYKVLPNRDSKYPFDKVEMERFRGAEKFG
jgi:hypothetical protein